MMTRLPLVLSQDARREISECIQETEKPMHSAENLINCGQEATYSLLCVLACMAFSAKTLHTPVLVAALRLDETRTISSIRVHDTFVFVVAITSNDILPNELQK